MLSRRKLLTASAATVARMKVCGYSILLAILGLTCLTVTVTACGYSKELVIYASSDQTLADILIENELANYLWYYQGVDNSVRDRWVVSYDTGRTVDMRIFINGEWFAEGVERKRFQVGDTVDLTIEYV